MEKELMTLNMIPDAMKTSTIHVYGYENKNLQGTFYNLYYGEEKRFDNLMQLMLLMEEMMDDLKYPKATMESRLVYKKREFSHSALAKELLPDQYSKMAVLETFHIRVMFRENASWQGTASWKKGKQQCSFRSALELIKMLDNVLEEQLAYSKETTEECS